MQLFALSFSWNSSVFLLSGSLKSGYRENSIWKKFSSICWCFSQLIRMELVSLLWPKNSDDLRGKRSLSGRMNSRRPCLFFAFSAYTLFLSTNDQSFELAWSSDSENAIFIRISSTKEKKIRLTFNNATRFLHNRALFTWTALSIFLRAQWVDEFKRLESIQFFIYKN